MTSKVHIIRQAPQSELHALMRGPFLGDASPKMMSLVIQGMPDPGLLLFWVTSSRASSYIVNLKRNIKRTSCQGTKQSGDEILRKINTPIKVFPLYVSCVNGRYSLQYWHRYNGARSLIDSTLKVNDPANLSHTDFWDYVSFPLIGAIIGERVQSFYSYQEGRKALFFLERDLRFLGREIWKQQVKLSDLVKHGEWAGALARTSCGDEQNLRSTVHSFARVLSRKVLDGIICTASNQSSSRGVL